MQIHLHHSSLSSSPPSATLFSDLKRQALGALLDATSAAATTVTTADFTDFAGAGLERTIVAERGQRIQPERLDPSDSAASGAD